MADSKDRQQQKKTKREVPLLNPPGESASLHLRTNNNSSPSPNPRHEGEVAPLAAGHTGSPSASPASEPVVPPESAEEKACKKRKLKDVWETDFQAGANGSVKPAMSFSPADATNTANPNHEEKERQIASLDVTGSVPAGTPLKLQSVSPIPDEKVLLVVLDKFQKKDTYGAFSKPVDPTEVPDYYEFIKNPMDFGTIRKNIERGIYTALEQLEKDVFLICSNAMSYNASSTIYYRQARCIQDLARKTFQTLRVNPEGVEVEHEHKSAFKNKNYISKKPRKKIVSGKSRSETTRTNFASGATLGSSRDHMDCSNVPLHDLVKAGKGTPLERTGGYSNGTGWILQGHHGADGNSVAEQSEELSGSLLKATGLKDGRRDLLWEEDRRGTYKPWNLLASRNDSGFAMLNGDPKQLILTGIQSEYAYARSLARFSAELGPAAWNIAAQKMQKALPSEATFGPGWVREYEAPHGTLLLQGGSRDQQTSDANPTTPNDFIQRKDRLHIFPDSQVTQQLSPSSAIAATTISVPIAASAGLLATLSAGLHSTTHVHIESPLQGLKQIPLKSATPVVDSSEVNLAGSKIASEVSQSRLLELVSRNIKFMQSTSKQSDHTPYVTGLKAKNTGNFVVDRRLDSNFSGMGREACDSSKLPSCSNDTNVATNSIDRSVHSSQNRSQAVWAAQTTRSEDHGVQDLNHRLGLQLRAVHTSVSAPLLGFSSNPSTATIMSPEGSPVEAWLQSQMTDFAHADSSSRIKMSITSDAHYNLQARSSSRVPQFMQQQIALDVRPYMQSSLSGSHLQSLSKLSQSPSQGGAGQIVESLTSNPMIHFAYMQEPAGHESPQSYHLPWQTLPSQPPFQHTSDLSHPPDLNVGFQSANSPVRQASGLLTDSQQPDLALQL